MRALLAALLLIAVAPAAEARPLDDDRTFARHGILLLDQPDAAYAAIAHPDGGTLFATYHGLLRLSAAGRREPAPPLVPAGIPHRLVSGLAVGVEAPSGEYGTPMPLSVCGGWRRTGRRWRTTGWRCPGGR